MRYNEITQTLTSSAASDWMQVREGPLYLNQFGEVRSGDQRWLETDSHYYLAVYKPDVDLRLAWGLQHGEEWQGESWAFPDRSITRVLVDGFWRAALVARWTALIVDGGRCYLPDADGVHEKTGEGPTDYRLTGWTASASEIRLARLLNEIVRGEGSEFDSYLSRANITEVPG